MIRRTVKVQLVLFVLLAVAGVLYLGFGLVGIDAIRPPFVVKARFATSGGIFTNAEVTYRGVGVGRVGALRLLDDGVEVELKIRNGKKIPADLRAVVANKSAVGEQFVDLQPRRAGAPYLTGGDVIERADTAVPIDIQTVAVDLSRLVTSIDREALTVLIRELGVAFEGTGPSLQQLIDSGDALTATLEAKLPETVQLIREGRIVLDTARDTAGDFRKFAVGLRQLTESLRRADPDVRRLLDNGVLAAREIDSLLSPLQGSLHSLLGDLITVNEIGLARLDGTDQVLRSLPNLVALVPLAIQDGSLHNGLVTEEAARACQYPEVSRQPREVGPKSPSLTEDCPPGTDPQRGAKSVRSPEGGPPSQSSSPSGPPSAPTLGPTESVVRWTGGQQQLLGERSWLALLLALL